MNACKRHATSCTENMKNRYHFEALDFSGRIILKWIVVQPCGLDGLICPRGVFVIMNIVTSLGIAGIALRSLTS